MTFDSHHDVTHLYFVTATICGWKRLFAEPAYANIVLDSLAWMRRNRRMALFAFVLMPSHLHTIVKPENHAIGAVTHDFGSFTAHEILKQLRRDGRTDLLEFFREQRRDPRHAHSIWQDIQAKNVYSPSFLREKLEYIHNNPIAKPWSLVRDRADYRYSSACYYDRGVMPIIEIDDVSEWL